LTRVSLTQNNLEGCRLIYVKFWGIDLSRIWEQLTKFRLWFRKHSR